MTSAATTFGKTAGTPASVIAAHSPDQPHRGPQTIPLNKQSTQPLQSASTDAVSVEAHRQALILYKHLVSIILSKRVLEKIDKEALKQKSQEVSM